MRPIRSSGCASACSPGGTFKYSNRVYDFGLRKFSFDDDFLLPTKLPPGTPMFRDVNTLTFRQLLRPNQ